MVRKLLALALITWLVTGPALDLTRPRSYRVAVMYGAGHMPDFDARLRTRGYRRVDVRWNTAWSF